MPIYPFERTVYPVRLPSPFLVKGAGKGVSKGPGGLLSASPDQVDGDGDDGARKRANGSTKITSSAGGAYITPYQPLQTPYSQQVSQRAADRSVVSAAGGLVAIGGPGQLEKLSPETAKLFDRDPETNEVLWFAAPPLNMSRPNGPRHSLAYLQFLAAKRRKNSESENNVEVENHENGDGRTSKRARISVPPTVTETMQQVWKEVLTDAPMLT